MYSYDDWHFAHHGTLSLDVHWNLALWAPTYLWTVARLLPMKNFKESTRPKAEKLQYIVCCQSS